MAMRNPKSRNTRETSLRHVWLAGLGLVSLVRHDAMDAAGRLLGEVAGARQQARGVIGRARSLMLAFAGGARRRFDPVFGHFEDGIGARFAPLLRKQALRPRAAPRAGRKPAASACTRHVDDPGTVTARIDRANPVLQHRYGSQMR